MKSNTKIVKHSNEYDISFVPLDPDNGFTFNLFCPHCNAHLGLVRLEIDTPPILCQSCKKEIYIKRVPTLCTWQIRRTTEAELKCPHVIRKRAGDESYDICEVNTKSCLIEHGIYRCYIYEEWRNDQDS